MTYYFARTLAVDFDTALQRVTDALKVEGFGVLTQIDVKKTMHEKIGVTFRNYMILGACNPQLAHDALSLEDKIGTMLPCNVVVQQRDDGQVEVAAVDPVASMMAVDNAKLKVAAAAVREKLQRVIANL